MQAFGRRLRGEALAGVVPAPTGASAAAAGATGGGLAAAVERYSASPVELIHRRTHRHCHRTRGRRWNELTIRRCFTRPARLVWTPHGFRWRPPERVCRVVRR